MKKAMIATDEKNCVGCNKCIVKCPVNANDSRIVDGSSKIFINQDRCIKCGECIHICDHQARYYEDDIDEFMNRLKQGDRISVLVAPAIRNSIPEYKQLFGYLKQLGVRMIYDVSFGADITTWAYLKAVKESNIASMIAQPCPVVVSYIQKYQTKLIPYLAPVQSPVICAAIYLKKYKNISDDLAFFSPCIGKGIEFEDENTFGAIKYNVTISKLKKYAKAHSVNLRNVSPADFDDKQADMGFAFSRPGGLRENVEYYTGGTAWVRQVEGIEEVGEYLHSYENRLHTKKKVPLLIDALNCKHGCNLGTATDLDTDIDDIDYTINQSKMQFLKTNSDPAGSSLFDEFDRTLRLDDFKRQYTDESLSVQDAPQSAIESVFQRLGKTTEESRKINCFACGYGGCLKFATAVANGNNDVGNCINYSRTKLKTGREEFDELFVTLEERLKHTNDQLKDLKNSAQSLNNIAKQTKIISINATIESANAGQYGKGFAVVASEIKSLAGKSEEIIQDNQKNQDKLLNNIQAFEKYVNEIKERIDGILQ